MSGTEQVVADVLIRGAAGHFSSVAAGAAGHIGTTATDLAHQATRVAQELGTRASDTVEEAAQALHVVASDAAGQIGGAIPIRFQFGWMTQAAIERVGTAADSVTDIAWRFFHLASSAAATCRDSIGAGARPLLQGDLVRASDHLANAISTCAEAVATSVEVLAKLVP